MNKRCALTLIISLSILITACGKPLAEVEIIDPANGSTISCDISQGDDQCFITVTGKATLPEGHHICLYLKFQGSAEGWIGGGPIDTLPGSGEWTFTHVGAGELNQDDLPPLLIVALITDETCTVGSTQQNPPVSLVDDTIQVHR